MMTSTTTDQQTEVSPISCVPEVAQNVVAWPLKGGKPMVARLVANLDDTFVLKQGRALNPYAKADYWVLSEADIFTLAIFDELRDNYLASFHFFSNQAIYETEILPYIRNFPISSFSFLPSLPTKGKYVLVWEKDGSCYRGKLVSETDTTFTLKIGAKGKTFKKMVLADTQDSVMQQQQIDCWYLGETTFQELIFLERSRAGYLEGFHFSSDIYKNFVLPYALFVAEHGMTTPGAVKQKRRHKTQKTKLLRHYRGRPHPKCYRRERLHPIRKKRKENIPQPCAWHKANVSGEATTKELLSL